MIYAHDHAKCPGLKFLIALPIMCRHVCLFHIALLIIFWHTAHFRHSPFSRGVPPLTKFHGQCSTRSLIYLVSSLVLNLLPCCRRRCLSHPPTSLKFQEMLRKRWFFAWFTIMISDRNLGRDQREVPTTIWICRMSLSKLNMITRGLVMLH